MLRTMRFHQIALFLVLASVANSVVSANDAGIKEEGLAFRPTEAPLMMSTARPTVAPKVNKPSPTRAMNFNVPPRVKNVSALKENEKLADVAPIPAPAMEETDPMVAMESKDASPVMLKSQEIHSHKMQVGDVKPIQVTGFITRNGNIYEIEGKDGIGLIEGRQSPAEDKKVNVCNYGSVVIYSDVPCDQVTTVKVGGTEQHSDTPQANAPVPSVDSSNNSSQPEPQDYDDLEDFDENSARRREQQDRDRRRNGNGNRRRNDMKKRPTQNGKGKRQGNRVQKPTKTQQQLRQQQKKRQQMQRQQQKRRQQQLQRQKNKNQWNREDQGSNQQQLNRRKVAQRQQEDDYYSGDDGQDEYEIQGSNQPQQQNRRKVAQRQQEDDYYSGDDGQDEYEIQGSNQPQQQNRRKVAQLQLEDEYYSEDDDDDDDVDED